jgi:tetratricopeptide (TPR) repeat protein
MNDDGITPDRNPAPPSPANKRRWLPRLAALTILLAGLALLTWYLLRPRTNMEAVQEINNRGVGLMERFDYKDAVTVFEEVVKMAPEWLPGRINLGIALLNDGGDNPAQLPRCRAVFEEVLRRDPDNPYANFCLGILLFYQKEDAGKHFEAVLQKDPRDASSWYWLGLTKAADPEEQLKCFNKALERNHHLRGALYGKSQQLLRIDPQQGRELMEIMEALRRADWENITEIKFSRMGHYAEVIGRSDETTTKPRIGPLPVFERCDETSQQLPHATSWASVQLSSEKASWLTATDFKKLPNTAAQIELANLRRKVRERFGATMVVLDYNRDGRPDLFLAGAILDDGNVRDLLLRNEGGGRFQDATAEAGLLGERATLGCCVGDFDNDDNPDLLLTCADGVHLFRNTGKGTFENVTKEAGLAELRGVFLTASALDLDQDSDLDMIFCQYAATAEEALQRFAGAKAGATGNALAYLHIGEAPPVKDGQIEPPLRLRYAHKDLPGLRSSAGGIVGVAASDMDGDRDLDLLLLRDGAPPAVVVNERLLKFQQSTLTDARLGNGDWNGALVLDVDHDGRSELLVLPADQSPRLLRNRHRAEQVSPVEWFETVEVDAPPLRQAVAVDLDMDTWTDVVGISREGQLVVLHNTGGQLVWEKEAYGRSPQWSQDLIGVAVCDMNGDGSPDVLVWSDKEGLQLYLNRGNGNRALEVRLRGHNMNQGQNRARCNADGVGVWAIAQAKTLWAGQEYTTLSAGLGQSRPPLHLGIGQQPHADVLRLRWPDGTWQAELNLLPGAPLLLPQYNRLPGSCPILYTWNGRRFAFVNDFLGAGSIGETAADGSHRPPRSEESVSIEAEQLVPRDGQYVLKFAEPMDETTYLDSLHLVVVDRPPNVRVYPDERFVTTDPPPSQHLIAFDKEIFPVTARDHRGRDVTDTLRRWDRIAVDDFAKRAWVGFAEEHAIELDFGDRLASFGAKDRLYLCLAGWTEYPWPESSWAAHQAGVVEQWPILERQDDAGQWRSLGESGFPAGMPRLMLVDVTGKVSGSRCRLRLRTNMHVYWDQAFVAAECRTVIPGTNASDAVRATCLAVHQATLTPGRLPAEYSPDGRLPNLYDYHRSVAVPLVGQSGRMTRFGNVTELLHRRDDCFVVFGPGDDLTVRFDAASLPPLPTGWKRSFVLRTTGYCKDTGLSTAHGATVEPLPFAAMHNYPYDSEQRYPEDALHRDYRRRYQTREVQANPWPRKK